MKIKAGIIGMGAVGCVLASYLERLEDIEMHYFMRSEEKKVEVTFQQSSQQLSFLHSKNYSKLDLDWVFICLKYYDYPSALGIFNQLIKPQSLVFVIRNGIELKSAFRGLVSDEQIIETIIDCPINQIEEGYEQLKALDLYLRKKYEHYPFAERLKKTGINLHFKSEFEKMQWIKLSVSSAIGSLQCVMDESSWIIRKSNIHSLLSALLWENFSIGRKAGIQLKQEDFQDALDNILNYPDDKGSSMLNDFRQGKPLEWMAKSGAIIKKAKELKVPCPLNSLLQLKLQAFIKN